MIPPQAPDGQRWGHKPTTMRIKILEKQQTGPQWHCSLIAARKYEQFMEHHQPDYNSPDNWVTAFALADWGNYSEKQGFSVLWWRDGDGLLDIHGRAVFGLWLHYGRPVIDLLGFRIMFT